MTTISNFNIATDIKVEVYVPNAAGNVFILGVSELGGTDVLGGDGTFILGYSVLGGTDVLSDGSGAYSYIWEPLEAEVTAVDVSLGGTIQSNISFQPMPAEAKVTMQSWTYDPTNNASIRSGTKIRVRLLKGAIDQTIFSGYIEDINVGYRVDGPNTIQISALDGHKRLVNKRIPSWDTTGYGASIAPTAQINALATATGFTLSAASQTLDGLLPTSTATNVVANTYLNDALEVGLGILWINPQTGELELRRRPLAATGGSTTYVVGNNHPVPPATNPYHLCMSDIKINSNADNSINSLKVSLSSNSATFVVKKDQDAIDLYGEISKDIDINTTDSTELTRWANAAFSGVPTKHVELVMTPAKDRLGNLTQAAFFTPGTLIGVNYQTDNINIVDYYTIIKTRQSVTVDTWFTTLELWKEF